MKRQPWKCEACGKSGVVEHEELASVYDVIELLRTAHGLANEACALQNGIGKVRVER
jgi:hypothetical protein